MEIEEIAREEQNTCTDLNGGLVERESGEAMQPSNDLVRDCEVEVERCIDVYCRGKEVRLLTEEEKATLARIKVVMG